MPEQLPTKRAPVTLERVVTAAMTIADQGGLGTLTMRSLAADLGVTPMSLYHHVANKDALLDALVDSVFAEIGPSVPGNPWRQEIADLAARARLVLGRHAWAIGLLEARASPGPNVGRHVNAVIGTFREAGFSIEATAHAYALLDSFIYGFVIQEASMPFRSPDDLAAVAEPILAEMDPQTFPYIMEFMSDHVLRPGYGFGAEFDWGLERVLDAIEGTGKGIS